jgi:8-oxo-dGTP pyrophosphatase MutT (NUDIX family)
MVIHVWLQNSKGQFLITKRSPNKGFPNMWECTGGSALAGDDSLSAAMREVKEETGLTLISENGKVILSGIGTDYFYDIWVFQQDFELKEVVLLEGETCDVRYATAEEILKMQQEGIFVPYEYLAELFQKIGLIRE